MEKLLEAIKNNDLVEAKKAFASIMATKTQDLIENERLDIAKSFIIEGEGDESDPEDNEGEDDDKKDDKKEPKDKKKGDEEKE